MAYTIQKTSGSVLATVNDGTIDSSSTDLTLIGKNYSGYGDALNENFVHLLENFAATSAPTTPLAGQLWWDTTGNLLKVYTGTAFKTVSSSTASSSAPTGGVVGDLWWDTGNSQLKIWNGSSWTLVGPAFSSGSGQSGPIVETISDGANDHVCVKIMISDVIVAIVSKDASFTPSPAITGFSSIAPGYNLSSDISNNKLNGTATDSDALGGVAAANYLRSDQADSTSASLAVAVDTNAFTVGADNDLNVSVSGSDVTIKNVTSDGDLILGVNDGGVAKAGITVDGATGEVLVLADPTQNLGVATKAYVDAQLGSSSGLARDGSNTITGDILPDTDNTHDLGSSTVKFAEIHATTFSGESTSAKYADLAERFAADNVYTPGTLMALGGAEEITQVNEENTENVFGVISSRAAYLMNAGAGDNDTHPAIAISGRVPVRVIGEVRKGDRLVSAGNGLARAGSQDEITAFNVVGRALENKYTSNEGLVECFVKVN